jgi:transcriptional regulator with XRE-family HTH domain
VTQGAPTPGSVVAEEILRLRRRREWTQQAFAERLSELGMPMDRSVIAKIETKKRQVSIDELFAIAAALEVSPMSLVIPHAGASQDPYSVVPSYDSPIESVISWWQGASGLTELDGKEVTQHDSRFFDEALCDIHVTMRRRYPDLHKIWCFSTWAMCGYAESPSGVVETIEDIEDHLSALKRKGFADINLRIEEARQLGWELLSHYHRKVYATINSSDTDAVQDALIMALENAGAQEKADLLKTSHSGD